MSTIALPRPQNYTLFRGDDRTYPQAGNPFTAGGQIVEKQASRKLLGLPADSPETDVPPHTSVQFRAP